MTAARSSGRAVIRATRTPSAVSDAGELAGVRVARVADGQLRADAQELGGQQTAASDAWPWRRSVACRAGTLQVALVSSVPTQRPIPAPSSSRSITLDDPMDSDRSQDRRGARRPARGLRAQLLATRDAAIALGRAHLDLARAELSAIAGEVGRVAGLVAMAIAVLILAACSGSSAWPSSSGSGCSARSAGACSTGSCCAWPSPSRPACWRSGSRVGGSAGRSSSASWWPSWSASRSASNGPTRLYATAGESARLNVDRGRPPARRRPAGGCPRRCPDRVRRGHPRRQSGGSRLGAIVGLAIVGALLGAFSAITFGAQVGAAVGITFGYLTWIVLMGVDVARNGVDVEGMKSRFYPTQTIDTGKETLEWLQKRMPPGIGS